MSKCAVCHKPVKSGIVVHSECMELLQKTQQVDNKPLTIEELRGMGGEPYWHVGLQPDSPPPHWVILDPMIARCPEDYQYGKRWLAYIRKPNDWISVKDREPPLSEIPFLAFNKWGNITIDQRRGWGDPDLLVGGLRISRDITHWMQRPAPPEVE